MSDIIKLQWYQIGAAFLFIVILLLIVKSKGISREREILISSIRMTLQLIMIGYVLVYIFDNKNPFFTLGIIAVMESFAISNIYKRIKTPLSGYMKKIIAVSLLTGTILSIAYFLFVVVGISPWYDPRYFIPIAGMLMGNSMTAVTLGVSNLIEGMDSRKHLVESALMLGATPKAASKEIVDNAFDSAILPTINSMVSMGIISLPGMTTGQILSGTSPVTAVGYQIAIMLGILGSASLCSVLSVQLGYKTFFNEECQLKG